MALEVGLEPTTDRLTADCSTAELLRNGTFGGRDRNRTDIEGFAVLCITTLPLGLSRPPQAIRSRQGFYTYDFI